MRKVIVYLCSATIVVGMVGIAAAISNTGIFKPNYATGSVLVPEPATLLLLGCGLISVSFFGRKKFPPKSH